MAVVYPLVIGVAEGGSGGFEEPPPWEVQIARENSAQCFFVRMFSVNVYMAV